MKSKKGDPPRERKDLPLKTTTIVLTEAGYRCAVPTCRNILALDMHHIWEVAAGGGDDPPNLIALCPTCHALYHRGTISQDAIYSYKAMLVAISRAFDLEAIDRLLFLNMLPEDYLVLSGDGVLHFARLIAAGLAGVTLKANNAWQLVTYTVNISDRGRQIIEAWRQGDRTRLALTLVVRSLLQAQVRRYRPNHARHRIAALLRFGINVKGHIWAARGARER